MKRMPISPDDTFELPLTAGGEVPGSMIFRCPTGRQQRQLAVMLEGIESAGGAVAAMDASFEAARMLLAGWRDVRNRSGAPIECGGETIGAGDEIPFAPENLEDGVTYQQAQDLAYRVLAWSPLADGGLAGNSGSQSSSSAGESAGRDSAESA